MINLATKFNQHGSKCKYYLNETNDLGLFSSNMFDFIYSVITLQHMEPRYAKSYIKEFLRILVPQGLLIFQIPSKHSMHQRPGKSNKKFIELIKKRTPNFILNLYSTATSLWKWGGNPPEIESHCIPKEEIMQLVEDNGAKIIEILTNPTQYCVIKD